MNSEKQCRNPNHALVDGSPHPHEIGSSCMATLEQVADVVLAYRPKSKQPKPRKRKKAKRVKRG
jgi:hypothetical protein